MGWLTKALRISGPPALFGLQLWASVSLALYVAYWLELDNPFWAGASAGLVCQPSVGASLRKGWFRLIGTIIGAAGTVVMTACFPQDRTLFLLSLTLWCAASAFCATILRNFASYSAALAGYTAVIIASDQLGSTGGLNGQAFTLAVVRATEISIGIVSAGIVLAGTDFGGARRRLAQFLTGLTSGMMAHFAETLSSAGRGLPDMQSMRRDYIRRVAALDPIIDETIGESSQVRYHSPVLQQAMDGLFTALSAWRAIANHIVRVPDGQVEAEAAVVLRGIPPALVSLLKQDDPAFWTEDPIGLGRTCEAAVRELIALPADTASQRLLTDKTAEVLMGILDVLNGLALLVGDPARSLPQRQGCFHLRVPDWLPALVNAGRVSVTIGAVALFWIVTAWPSGAVALVWAATVAVLYSPQADQAYATASGYTVGTVLATPFAAILAFAVLPQLETFAGFAMAVGLYLIPAGALAFQPRHKPVFGAMSAWFMLLLEPTNPMSYDIEQFYNTTFAFVAGVAVGALSFRLIPPLPPALQTHRLLALTLRDLHRLAMRQSFADWVDRIYGRLEVMPGEATPLQHARLLAALSLGIEINSLLPSARRFGVDAELERALADVAEGRSAIAIARLKQLDEILAIHSATEPEALCGRASILVISEVLSQHSEYFDSGA
jgi:uncharacterized membrane protein YccC